MLPPLYKMENYTHCAVDSDNYYCFVQARLTVPSTNLNIIKLIKNSSLDISRFDRNFIYRTLGIPKSFIEDKSKLYSYSSTLVNQDIERFKLSAQIEDATCKKIKLEMNVYDIICLAVLVFYNILVILATFKGKSYEKKNGLKCIISKLSLVHTWKLRSKVPDTRDFKNLRNMNGSRVLAMLFIIFIHLAIAYNTSFISKPEVYEHVYRTILDNGLGCLPVLIVSYFFLVSSWLLTTQVYNIHEKGQLSFKNIGILIINRYFRLNFLIIVILIISETSWSTVITGPANFYPIIANQKACTENWFPSIFLFTNFYRLVDICNAVTWHVSADFQLYIINLFILYIKFKCNFNDFKFCATILIFSIILHGITLHIYDAGPLYQPSLRYFEARSLYHSLKYVISYMSTPSLWSSSFIGVIFGIIYIRSRNISVKPNTGLNIVWFSISIGLIYLSNQMGAINVNGIKASLLGSIIKPIFCIGCGLGVYGMSHNFGGPLKKLMESKLLVLLSNYLYGVYLIHMPCVISMNRYFTEPVYIDFWKLLQDYIIGVIISFLVGIYITLTIEEPGNLLRKKILPQINKWDISKTN
ncbi:O-acyltransferase like protein-like isoform X1 [Diabrotica virgifera virgifera]|uniref:Acyltransferase 3 domain-containing protein n=1 Tax=Diabrotica virgifera virgifera TaxID=50390 RepID=A0ABM5K6E9_DIAVI|nr:O-acyltransferase like protein-like isoform X1 [Diabrotica virgifera virgifera]